MDRINMLENTFKPITKPLNVIAEIFLKKRKKKTGKYNVENPITTTTTNNNNNNKRELIKYSDDDDGDDENKNNNSNMLKYLNKKKTILPKEGCAKKTR